LLLRPGGRPFAGLRECWKDEAGKPVETCTILTTAANAAVAQLHDRMPVILTDPAKCGRWLAADDVGDLLRPLPDNALAAVPVNPVDNSPKHDGPECVEPVA
jgi:putative SOS response-associated peptidase YedK